MIQAHSRRTVAVALILVAALSILLVEPFPVHASGATLVQQSSGYCNQPEGHDCASGMVTASFGSSVTSGDVVVVGAVYFGTTGVSSVSDSLGSSFTQAVSLADKTGLIISYIYYAPLSTSGTDSVTVSYNLSGAEACNSPTTTTCALDVYIYEVSGVTTVGAATGSGNTATASESIATSSVAFNSGAFLLGMMSTSSGYPITPGSGFTLSTPVSISAAQYATSGVGSPTDFPASSPDYAYYWVETGLALEPGTIVVVSAATTSVSDTTTTQSMSTTSSSETTSTTSATTVSQSPSITNTLVTTTTTIGFMAGTSTTTFTSPFSTSYSTSSTVSTSEGITETGVTTVSTVSSPTITSTSTVLSTTTSSGTLTITKTDVFSALLTTIYQELHQFSDNILQFLGFQVTATPVGQQVNQVIVTTTTTPAHVTMTVSYSVIGGGSGYSPPVFHYILGGMKRSVTLRLNEPESIQVDTGSSWFVTPNPLTGSTSSEQWYANPSKLSGRASATTIVFTFQHQYYLTMKVSSSTAGSVTPSSGWYNKGVTVTIKATAKTGHTFKSWTGSGTGSYTGTSATHTITMNAAITETAYFT